MKFITEMELRDLYKTEPFATYFLPPDTKITPGARQFLTDRRVTLVHAQCSDVKKSSNESNQAQVRESWSTLRLRRRMDRIESLFLLVAAELLHVEDAVLSEELIELGKCFRNVQKAEREQKATENFLFWGWSEEKIKRRYETMEKFIDLREFQVGLENGKEIAQLNYLRACLREVEPALLETYWDKEKQVCSRQDLIDKVNLMINIVGVMMYRFLGGNKWK